MLFFTPIIQKRFKIWQDRNSFMLFKYIAKTAEGAENKGAVEAPNLELAVSAIQRKGLIITSIFPEQEATLWQRAEAKFQGIKFQEIVIISRQLSTLFEAKVPVVDSLKILLEETDNSALKKNLSGVIEDIEGGASLSQSFANHPDVFSKFYVNMVRVGEESGKLDEIFLFLADYLERSYELSSKVKNAFIYPAFVLVAFLGVMAVILTVVVPKLTSILNEAGQEIPIFTKIIIEVSDILRNFGVFLLAIAAAVIFFFWRYLKTENGRMFFSKIQLSVPVFNKLFREFYLARVADNLDTLLSGGVAVVRSFELTAELVGNEIYRKIIEDSVESIKGGGSISATFSRYKEMPPFVTQMIRIGEETGKLNFILQTISRFYRKEINITVDNLVKLIEPILILFLGGGVAIIVAAVLVPIYNIASTV